MFRDFTILLWLLKLGALFNLYFLANTRALPAGAADAHIVIPAQILFAVSAFRCVFPNRYKDNVVFHRSPLSSIFLTRVLATLTEVAYIYQFSHVIRLLNVDHVGWVYALSWVMVLERPRGEDVGLCEILEQTGRQVLEVARQGHRELREDPDSGP